MDAVNVDLDEMRARVDSTHSIITSRQRVEATVTAEISTMRLDMGDMQEAQAEGTYIGPIDPYMLVLEAYVKGRSRVM